jgi:short-subunit dehydrogenase
MAAYTNRPLALITGASVGIGYELAKVFAANGHDLVLVARDEPRLLAVAAECESAGAKARVIAADLAVPGAAQAIHDRLDPGEAPIEVLVNNAGFGTHGEFAAIDVDADLRMLQVNIVALTHLTKLFLREMIRRKSGKILNVASTAAFQPGPLMATYYASKAYVLSFSEAIAVECKPYGVTVTALCPGATRTEFQKRAGIESSRLFRGNVMDARTVALAGYRGLTRGKRIVIPGAANRLLTSLVPFAPRKLVTRITKRFNDLKRAE